jgi:hypothetical protein
MKNGELTIVITKIIEGDGINHWQGELLYNDDTVSQAIGLDFATVIDELINYAQTENSTIDPEWFDN